MIAILAPVLVVAAATTLALRSEWAGSWLLWLTLLVPYLALGAWAVRDLHSRELLSARLRPRGGDISLGILMGLAMAAAGVLAQRVLMPPGSAERGWLFQLYVQVGDLHNSGPLLAIAALVVLLEELVWRGLVLEHVKARWNARAAAPLSALAYGVAHVPSLWLLSNNDAGMNPLLVLAALGCGAVWGFFVLLTGRMWPVIVAHWVFTYFMSGPLPAWL